MSTPTVSVIMPCHDHGEFLEEAVESVQAQTFQDFEILIVDDGSTDPDTVALLSRFDRPKTRVQSIAHAGVTHARNVAIRQARGRYLTFFDCDDRMHPEYLERAVSVLENDPTLAFVSSWARVFGDEDWEWKPERCDFPWLLHECSVSTAALVRSSVVVDVGGFDETLELGHEDWDLWLSIVERGHRGTILPQFLFLYRRSRDSRSSVADRPGTYLELYRDRIAKHEAVYREHLFELLWLKERAVIGPRLAALPEEQRKVEFELAPRVARLRARVEAAFARSVDAATDADRGVR